MASSPNNVAVKFIRDRNEGKWLSFESWTKVLATDFNCSKPIS